MQTTRGGEPSPRAGGARWCLFGRLWWMCRDAVKFFGACLQENVLLHPFRGREAQRERPAHRTFHALMADLKSAQPVKPVSRYAAAGLVLVATAAVVVSIGAWLMLASNASTPGRLITTGADETMAVQLPDGGVFSLDVDSAVRVNVTQQQRSARVVRGAVTFDVPDLTTPFVVETPLARVRVPAQAKFRVAVSELSVDFDVYQGTVLVYDQRAEGAAQAVRLEAGETYHMWAHAMASLAADHRGRVSLRGGTRSTDKHS